MQRQILHPPSARGSEDVRKSRQAKNLPSISRLPACWNQAMDVSVCYMEAQNEVYAAAMVRLLKRRFPELESYVIPVDAVERRIESLDLRDNDYFKKGMEDAVENAVRAGLVLDAYDPANYPSRKFERKSDLEVYGSGAPMTGLLGFGAYAQPDNEMVPHAIRKVSMVDRSRVPTPRKSLGYQRSDRNDGRGTNRVQIAGEYVQPNNLTDITNQYNSPGLPVTPAAYSNLPVPASTNAPAVKAANPPLPVTPVNAQPSQSFSTPGSRDKHTKTDKSLLPSTTYTSTPSRKDKNGSKGPSGNAHSAAQYISAPSNASGKAADTSNSSTGGLYRSGKENTTSGKSNSTTGTSILGKEITGMSAVIDRRHERLDRRATPDNLNLV